MTAFTLTRRNLLAGLAAATAVAAVPVSASLAPAENPDLLALADSLDAAIAEAAAAQDAYAECVATWAPFWPTPPDYIRVRGNFGEVARTMTGIGITDDREHNIRVVTVEALDTDLASIRKAMSRKRRDPSKPFHAYTQATEWGVGRSLTDWAIELDQLSDLKQVAMVYEAEKARILAASGYVAKEERRDRALTSLKRAIGEVMAQRPHTIEGLLIQAQAMAAFSRLDPWQKANASLTTNWGADFAASLIRISSAA